MANFIQKLTGGAKKGSKESCCGVEILEVKEEANDSCCKTTVSSDSCCETNDSSEACCG
jgi:hypothetical protein